jgi:RNA polymerase sigma-70 factor, ECF subfamily
MLHINKYNDYFHMNDRESVSKILQGNIKTFGLLYEKYFPKIYRMVSRTISSQHDCEDIVQDIFIDIVEGLKSYNSKYEFSTWIYTIGRNKINDYLRRKYRIQEVELTDNNIDEEKLESGHQIKKPIFENLIGGLKEEDKRLMKMRYIRKLKFIEIATEFKLTLNNIKVKHNRIIKKLRKVYEEKV